MEYNYKMGDKFLFRESQAFRQVWIWIILVLMNGLWLYTVVMQWGFGQPLGQNPAGDLMLAVIALFCLALTMLFVVFRLQTAVRESGIDVRFFPFQQQYRHISWDQIDRCYIRTYKPLAEYGGWGWRIGLSGTGQAYNVSGNVGLQLELKNRKRLLIGTIRPKELDIALQQLAQPCYQPL